MPKKTKNMILIYVTTNAPNRHISCLPTYLHFHCISMVAQSGFLHQAQLPADGRVVPVPFRWPPQVFQWLLAATRYSTAVMILAYFSLWEA